MLYPQEFDVIVVGGGHAGTEAALAAARMGCAHAAADAQHRDAGADELQPVDRRHRQGPSGQGGRRAGRRDGAGHRRGGHPVPHPQRLSKGPAVRATRAQADRMLYKAAIRRRLENQPNLWLFQQAVDDLMVEGDRVVGAVTQVGIRFRGARGGADGRHLSRRPDPCRPAELRGRPRGRPAGGGAVGAAEGTEAAAGPAEDRHAAAHRRPHASTSASAAAGSSPATCDPVPVFSFMGDAAQHPRQVPCWITHTNERTHDIIRSRLRPQPDVHRRDRRRGPALLPEHRRQGQPLRRQGQRTRSSWSPRA